jgi:hypothetical protein
MNGEVTSILPMPFLLTLASASPPTKPVTLIMEATLELELAILIDRTHDGVA